METPASMRRITRSQSAALLKKSKMQEKGEEKRQPLFNITNDSPITGLTTKETPTHGKTPCATDKRTPLSGESLLRRQVQTLLQKVEVEVEKDETSVRLVDEVVLAPSEQEEQLNRALFVDTPDESDQLSDVSSVNSSCLAYIDSSDSRETQDPISSSDDDCSSVWSLQVNASSEKDELDGEIIGETEQIDELELYDDQDEDHEEEEFMHDLCNGMKAMGIGDENERGKSVNFPEFRGTHTKFVYNSEDEIEEQLMVLRGLPAPEGMRVRFSYEDDE
ncbi:Chalcone-flavanone isomerase family protein [Rhynchospora pubera]|uniref:Chalcone-flavanone isomerase family protein n=1 Tax=Rhynchospora pubera TaxID=906938 RepID=A0AAV8GR22_9POAL|nr:Chalcone-flavanone isomerase family protein [Rhynchospora pubera]KAJ4805796.1 Chalcone-flavanone isomerase family protein [Rhynchospora pubera]